MFGLPGNISDRMRLPVIAAPMLRVSGVDLVTAACTAGVIGAFPTANARTIDALDEWLSRLDEVTASRAAAPYCPNLIIRGPRLEDDLACLCGHDVEVVITSVGSPASVLPALHERGIYVLADVATLHHARRAIEAGVDGLVLLTAGAGGQTGWMNPFAFVRAVREMFDGTIVLAGGISDGQALRAAEVLGADLAYMGTKMIAATESMASTPYKQMLVDSTLDDVMRTRAFTGLDTSMLLPSIVASGLDPANLDEQVSAHTATEMYGGRGKSSADGPQRWSDVWSAGHSVSGVHELLGAREIIERTLLEYTTCAPRATGREEVAYD